MSGRRVFRRRLGATLLAAAILVPAPAAVATAPEGGASPDAGFLNEAVTRVRADTWHQAGHLGEGIQIGIIGRFSAAAWDAASATYELPSPTATGCFVTVGTCSAYSDSLEHRVAEAVHDMAPGAELVLARVVDPALLGDAVDWFATQGTDVLLLPNVGRFDGPGDGTGPVAAAIDAAVTQGMVVVQAAGDAGPSGPHGGSYLRWSYADEDADGWLEFVPGDERLAMRCGDFFGLRWSDFGEGGAASDYDLHLFADGSQVATSSSDQSSGAAPVEWLSVCRQGSLELGVRLDRAGAAEEGDVLELLGAGMDFEHWTLDGSAAGPGVDSTNEGLVSVGAMRPALGTTMATSSSRGPTRDGRPAPDMVAPSCFTSVLAAPNCNDGTAAAAALVAGAAALRLEQAPSATPAEIVTWLTTEAVVDRGPPGPDDRFGAGALRLPPDGDRPVRRPDLVISGGRLSAVGDGVYETTGSTQLRSIPVRPGRFGRFRIRLENDGNAPERYLVESSTSELGGVSGWDLAFNAPGLGVDNRIEDAAYRSPVVAPGGSIVITLSLLTPDPGRPPAQIQGTVRAYSLSDLQTADAVRFRATRAR